MQEQNKLQKAEVIVPTIFNDVEFTGKENIDVSQHLKRPMLKIAHTQSSQVKKMNPSYIEGLEPGMFFHTVTGKIYGTEISIIPITFFTNCIVYGPASGGLGDFRSVITEKKFKDMIDKSIVKKEASGWVDDKNQQYVLTYNFVVLLADHIDDGLVLYPIHGKGLTPCKNLLTRMDRAHEKLYIQKWKIWTKYYTENTFEWWQIGEKSRELNAKFLGFIQDTSTAIAVRAAIDVAKDYVKSKTNIDYSDDVGTTVETEM